MLLSTTIRCGDCFPGLTVPAYGKDGAESLEPPNPRLDMADFLLVVFLLFAFLFMNRDVTCACLLAGPFCDTKAEAVASPEIVRKRELTFMMLPRDQLEDTDVTCQVAVDAPFSL